MLAKTFSTALAAAMLVGTGAFAASITPVSLVATCDGGGMPGLSGSAANCGVTADRRSADAIEFYDNPADLMAVGNFFSLGLGGSLVAQFATPFTGSAMVIEVTNAGSNQREAAEVFGSNDGMSFTSLGTVNNQTGIQTTNEHRSTLTFAGTYTYLGFRDVSRSVFANSTSTDGFDIGAVSITPAPVPLPAAGLLLIGGLAGLGALRKRKAA